MARRKPLERRELPVGQTPLAVGVVILPAVRRDGAWRDAAAVPGTLIEGLCEHAGEVVVGGVGGDGGEDRVDGGVGKKAGGGGGLGVGVGGEFGEDLADTGGDDEEALAALREALCEVSLIRG